MGLFRSLGLMQRTKDGSQLNSIFINTSKDLLNCALSVGDLFLVSSPCENKRGNISRNVVTLENRKIWCDRWCGHKYLNGLHGCNDEWKHYFSYFYEQNVPAYHRHFFGKQIEKKFHFTFTNKSHKIGAECVSILVEYSFETICKKLNISIRGSKYFPVYINFNFNSKS